VNRADLLAKPTPHPAVESEVFDDDGFEIVLYDTRVGRTIRLNQAASSIWYLCDASNTEKDIVDALVDVFGLDRHEAGSSVQAALADFARAGLLADSSKSAHEAPETIASILPRSPDPCGAPTGDLGWVRTVELTVNGWRVGVRASSEHIADAIAERFSGLLVQPGGWARTNFSIRRMRRVIGQYEILNAGVRVARARTLGRALDVLDGLLGGVAVFGHEPPAMVTMEIGLVVQRGLAVLVDVEGLKCTDRRWALDLLDGARATWRVLIDAETMRVHVPAPVSAGGNGPQSWQRFPLAGILLSDDGGRDPELLRRVYALAARERAAWFSALEELDDRVLTYRDLATAAPAVASLVARGPIRAGC